MVVSFITFASQLYFCICFCNYLYAYMVFLFYRNLFAITQYGFRYNFIKNVLGLWYLILITRLSTILIMI